MQNQLIEALYNWSPVIIVGIPVACALFAACKTDKEFKEDKDK